MDRVFFSSANSYCIDRKSNRKSKLFICENKNYVDLKFRGKVLIYFSRWKVLTEHCFPLHQKNILCVAIMSTSNKTSAKANVKSTFPAVVAIKVEDNPPAPIISDSIDVQQKVNSVESLLAKRKAERISSTPAATASTSTPCTSIASQSTAKLSFLEARMKQLKETSDNSDSQGTFSSNSYNTPTSSPLKNTSVQRCTNVQFNEWYVENGNPGEDTTVCVTLCNVYGLKDELLGFKPLPNGDLIYWPSRMFYPNQVSNIMNASNVSVGSEFLKGSYGKPLIVFSRLSETVPDPLLKFDEVVDYLKEFVDGRPDEASSGNPKKNFHLTIQKKPLNETQLDALIAISSRIYPSA